MGRLIDADALKELFREVIGRIAIKPEMNGNLEHMIRASAMVIQMIDDAPTVQPDTTTHDSIPAETGGNDEDRTSGDCISRQPERKTGRWIPDNTDYYRTKFICSACGESEEVPTTGFGYGTMWGYCPNCGADMRGEQE